MKKRIIKQVAVIVAMSVTANVYAVAPGFYIGAMGGPATNSGSTVKAQVQGSPTTVPATPKSQQFATGLFMGYQATKYWGIEFGGNFISNITYEPQKNTPTCGGTSASVRDLAILAKAIVPVSDAFDVYAKAGPAIVYESTTNALNPRLQDPCGRSQRTTKAVPAGGIGIGYSLTQNVVVDASYNLIAAGSPVNNVSFFGLGISYHIVDVYCGQFLC